VAIGVCVGEGFGVGVVVIFPLTGLQAARKSKSARSRIAWDLRCIIETLFRTNMYKNLSQLYILTNVCACSVLGVLCDMIFLKKEVP
jgi:hypothetical protein